MDCQPLLVMPLPTVQLVTGKKGYVTSGNKVLEECTGVMYIPATSSLPSMMFIQLPQIDGIQDVGTTI